VWEKPEAGDLEYGLRLDARLPKTEGSLMAGRFLANSPVYHPRGDILSGMPVLAKQYVAYDMVGLAATHASESLLLKLEAAFKHRLPLQGWREDSLVYACEKTDVVDAAAGVEYNANNRYQIAVEVSNRHHIDAENALQLAERNQTALHLTVTRGFLNQTLDMAYVLYYQVTDRDILHDIQLSYRPSDSLEIQMSFAYIDSSRRLSPLGRYRGEDRLTFEVRYFL